PQQFCLQGQRHFANLIQQERTAAGFGKQTLSSLSGSSESSGLMAKKLTFHQVGWNTRAVYRQERCARPLALSVNRPRHQFLARAAFAVDQDRCLTSCDLLNLASQSIHGLALADQP